MVVVQPNVLIDFSETVIVPASVPVSALVRGFQVFRASPPATS